MFKRLLDACGDYKHLFQFFCRFFVIRLVSPTRGQEVKFQFFCRFFWLIIKNYEIIKTPKRFQFFCRFFKLM